MDPNLYFQACCVHYFCVLNVSGYKKVQVGNDQEKTIQLFQKKL